MAIARLKPPVSHSVQMILYEIDSATSAVKVAVMSYTKGIGSRSFTTIRLPTETGLAGESVWSTAIRGTKEEAGKDESFVFDLEGHVHAEFFDDEHDPEGSHIKIAMSGTVREGELRDFPKVDDGDPDEFHGPLQWVDIGELLRNKGVDGLKLIHAHGASLCAFLHHLANMGGEKSKNIAYMYYPVMEAYPFGKLSRERRADLDDYLQQ
jgi:ADP-ribose pyrophosphatase YjhB (NUDIX family)